MIYKDIEQYKLLHRQKSDYGASGHIYVKEIFNFIKQTKPKTILDFGCGKESLKKTLNRLNINVDGYDPAIPNKNAIPSDQYDMIVTTDVMEHLHEDELESLFEDILKFQPKYMFHAISTRLAINKLPDGTNAHKTVKSEEWWKQKFIYNFFQFDIVSFSKNKTAIFEMIYKN
jgi:cyclopropane fatty-acyl-phospholipid synthase-like methyltransferase